MEIEKVVVRGNFRLRDLGLGEMGLLELGLEFHFRAGRWRKPLPDTSQTLGLQFHR